MVGKEIFDDYLIEGESLRFWLLNENRCLGISNKRVIDISPRKGAFNDIDLKHVTNVNFQTKSRPALLLISLIGFFVLILSFFLNIIGTPIIIGIILLGVGIWLYFNSTIRVVNVSTEKDTFTFALFKGKEAKENGLEFVKYVRKGMKK